MGVPAADAQAAIQRRLAATPPTPVNADEWKHVKKLYATFGQNLLWLDDKGVHQPRVAALLTALANADSDALRLDAFPLADLSRVARRRSGGQADGGPARRRRRAAVGGVHRLRRTAAHGSTEAGDHSAKRGTSIRWRSASTARWRSRCAKTISPRAWCECARRIPGTTRFACNSAFCDRRSRAGGWPTIPNRARARREETRILRRVAAHCAPDCAAEGYLPDSGVDVRRVRPRARRLPSPTFRHTTTSSSTAARTGRRSTR